MKLSICIPTHNRPSSIKNCLDSIYKNSYEQINNYEVCISDNSENNVTQKIVSSYKSRMPINYLKNTKNINRVKNYLSVVDMAKGDFIWMIGDDDLLTQFALEKILKLIDEYSKKIDFFYINSYLLDASYLDKIEYSYNLMKLPKNMKKFSKKNVSGVVDFFDLIDPSISFDFLGGMYLAVFKKALWQKNTSYIDKEATRDNNTFSYYDNTFPHVKIFAKCFSKSKAYFYHHPLSITLSGVREWSDLYPLVRSIRLVESVEIFRENGLPLIKYLYYKNYALRYFGQDIIKMLINYRKSGIKYLNFRNHILSNLIFPNFYLSFLYIFFRKLKLIN